MDNYPEAHPKAPEIKALKDEISAIYLDLKKTEENARTEYTSYMRHVSLMGDAHKKVHELVNTLVAKLNELEDLACEPLL